MFKNRLMLLLSLLLAFSLVISGCTQAAPKEKTLVIWARHDLTNQEDPPSVTMKRVIEEFEAQTGIKVVYEQVAWDQLATKLALQVQSGGDVPDIVEVGSQHVNALLNVGALMDISDLVKGASWLGELNPGDAQSCVRDGKRYCVATRVTGGAWYYKTADFPSGWPSAAQAWLTEGARLKNDGKYIATFFAGRHYASVELTWGPLIYSNGGRIFDNDGKPVWATQQTVEVVQWMRQLLAEGYIPETCFTGDFTAGEMPWVDGQASSVRGGTWSFLFIPGLDAQYGSGEAALGGGPAMSTGKNYVFLVGDGWGVPKGAKNTESALAWFNHFMQPTLLAEWANQYYGIPIIASALRDPAFDDPFYRAAAENLGKNGIFIEPSPYYQESLDALAIALQELMLNPNMEILPRLERAQTEILNRYW